MALMGVAAGVGMAAAPLPGRAAGQDIGGDPNERGHCAEVVETQDTMGDHFRNVCDEAIQIVWCAEKPDGPDSCSRDGTGFPRVGVAPRSEYGMPPYTAMLPRGARIAYWVCKDPWSPQPPVRRDGRLISTHCRW